jgi:hypothetical protein
MMEGEGDDDDGEDDSDDVLVESSRDGGQAKRETDAAPCC